MGKGGERGAPPAKMKNDDVLGYLVRPALVRPHPPRASSGSTRALSAPFCVEGLHANRDGSPG